MVSADVVSNIARFSNSSAAARVTAPLTKLIDPPVKSISLIVKPSNPANGSEAQSKLTVETSTPPTISARVQDTPPAMTGVVLTVKSKLYARPVSGMLPGNSAANSVLVKANSIRSSVWSPTRAAFDVSQPEISKSRIELVAPNVMTNVSRPVPL